jgi:hypothetical protein
VKTADRRIHASSPLYPLLADNAREATAEDARQWCVACTRRIAPGVRVADLPGGAGTVHVAVCAAWAAANLAVSR